MATFKLILNNHSDIRQEADQCEITSSGDLVLYREGRECRVHKAFARGIWLSVEQVAPLPNPTEHEKAVNAIELDTLELSVRTFNCLKNDGIHTIGAVRAKTVADLRRIPNLGRRSLDEITGLLADYGIRLASGR